MKNLQTRINGYYPVEIDGKFRHYPSVTTITRCCGDSFGLMRWAIAQGAYALYNKKDALLTPDHAKEVAIAGYETELERTGNFGSDTHYLIQQMLLKQEPSKPFTEYSEQVRIAYNTLRNFLNNESVSPILVESEVLNTTDNYSGRLDLFGVVKDPSVFNPYLKRSSPAPREGGYVFDIKTGSYHKQTHGIQLAAYANAINNYKVIGGIILHVERENPEKLSIQVFDDLTEYYNDFLAIKTVWERCFAPEWYKKQGA